MPQQWHECVLTTRDHDCILTRFNSVQPRAQVKVAGSRLNQVLRGWPAYFSYGFLATAYREVTRYVSPSVLARHEHGRLRELRDKGKVADEESRSVSSETRLPQVGRTSQISFVTID